MLLFHSFPTDISGVTHTIRLSKSVSCRANTIVCWVDSVPILSAYEVIGYCVYHLCPLSHHLLRLSPWVHSCLWFTFDHIDVLLTCYPYDRLLLIEFVAATATDGDATKAIERKDKRPLPIPVRILLDNFYNYMLISPIVLLLEIPTDEGMLLLIPWESVPHTLLQPYFMYTVKVSKLLGARTNAHF